MEKCKRREEKGSDDKHMVVFEPDTWAKKKIKSKFKEFNHHFSKQYSR